MSSKDIDQSQKLKSSNKEKRDEENLVQPNISRIANKVASQDFHKNFLCKG